MPLSKKFILLPGIPEQVDIDDLDWSLTPPRLSSEKIFHTLLDLKNKGDLPEGKRISKHLLRETQGLESLQYSPVFFNQNGRTDCLLWYKGETQHKHLGMGNLGGKVKLVQNQETGEWLAGKITGKANPNETHVTSHLGQFYGQYKHNSLKRHRKEIHSIIKYAPGKTLAEWKDDSFFGKMPDSEFIQIILSSLKALQTLHGNSITHGDIHARNIKYDFNSRTAELIDFGKSDMDSGGYHQAFDIKMMAHMLSNLFGLDRRTRTHIRFPEDSNDNSYDYFAPPAHNPVFFLVVVNCSIIKDDVIYRELQHAVTNLAHNTISLSEAITQLENLSRSFSEPVVSHYIDINNWISSDQDQKKQFPDTIQRHHRIILCSDKAFPEIEKTALRIKRALSKQGFVFVAEEIELNHPAHSLEEQISQVPDPERSGMHLKL